MVWPAVIAGAAAIGSAVIGSMGSRKASDAYSDSAEKAAEAQLEMYYQSRNDLRPYTGVGDYAIGNLLGTPAQYAATNEDVESLIAKKASLNRDLKLMETKGVRYTTRSQRDNPNFYWDDPTTGPATITTTGTAYRKAKPGEIQDLKNKIQALDGEIQTVQEKTGELVKEGTPGIMDQYPDALPYPDIPESPVIPDAPTHAAYPTLEERPFLDFGQGIPSYPGGGTRIGFTGEDFKTSPGYEWRLGEAQKAVERMAAARGYRLSPRALTEFSKQSQGMAADEYGNWFNQQLQKSDLALSSWMQGRVADIQDWQLPYEANVADWTRQAGTDIQNWQNKRDPAIADWSNQNQARSSDWLNKYNALANLLRVGQSSATGQAAAASDVGNSLAANELSQGVQQSDQYINQANILANSLNSGVQNVLTAYNAYNAPNQNTNITKPSWELANDFGNA